MSDVGDNDNMDGMSDGGVDDTSAGFDGSIDFDNQSVGNFSIDDGNDNMSFNDAASFSISF